jgi:hypothetical protein
VFQSPRKLKQERLVLKKETSELKFISPKLFLKSEKVIVKNKNNKNFINIVRWI